MKHSEIVKMTRILGDLYQITGMYCSRASLYGEALDDGIITKEEYIEVREYYGNLWYYVGD